MMAGLHVEAADCISSGKAALADLLAKSPACLETKKSRLEASGQIVGIMQGSDGVSSCLRRVGLSCSVESVNFLGQQIY